MSNHRRKTRQSMVAVLVLSLLAPVSGLTASVVEAAAVVETIGEGSSVEQLSCPPGLTGPTCQDGIPQPSGSAINVAFENIPTTIGPIQTGAQVNLQGTAPASGLATRSRGSASSGITGGGNLVRSGSGPFTYTGPGGYTFESDAAYAGGQLTESYPTATLSTTNIRRVNKTTGTTTVNNAVYLKNSGSCSGNDNSKGYCSAFGPEVWTEKFTGLAGDFLAFAYAAADDEDDYEIYAFLVDVSTADYAAGTHTLLAHGRGANQPWRTVTGAIPTDGSFRFRFVNGTYDATGGTAVGSDMWVDPTIWVGTNNFITMDPIGDKVRGSSNFTFQISAKAASDGLVTFVSGETARCTVSASTKLNDGTSVATVTIPSTATNGNCPISASTPQFARYVPAPTITRGFNVCNSAPSHGGGQALSGVAVEGERLEVNDGTINSCGDNYVRSYQWQVCNELPCTADSHFSDYGPPLSTGRGFGPSKDVKGSISLTSALEGKRLRAKLTVTSDAGSFTVATAATDPVVGVPKRSGSDSGSDPTGAGPVSEPKPFVLPSGDTPRATPGEVLVYEGGTTVVVTSQPVTVGGIQSVRLGGTSAGGGKFEMTIGGDCPTCAVTQENDGKNVLGMEQAAAVRVGGYGFGPGSQVNVFVSSTTRLIGFFKADGDGAFLGSVKVPTDLPRGNHTIQVSGFTADNVIRSVSVGITVNRATPKACRVVKRKGKKPVTVCPKKPAAKKVTKKK